MSVTDGSAQKKIGFLMDDLKKAIEQYRKQIVTVRCSKTGDSFVDEDKADGFDAAIELVMPMLEAALFYENTTRLRLTVRDIPRLMLTVRDIPRSMSELHQQDDGDMARESIKKVIEKAKG